MWRNQFQQYEFEYVPKMSLVTAIAFIVATAFIATTSFPPVSAAEKIKFNHGITSQSVSLEELEIFAETGEISPALNFLFDYTNQNPKLVRLLLIQQIPLDTVTASNLLNSPIGESVLDRVSSVVNSGASKGNREALRGALITSTNGDGKISLLEVWRNYPTKEVIVEGTSWRKMTDKFSCTLQRAGTRAELAMTLLHDFLNPR